MAKFYGEVGYAVTSDPNEIGVHSAEPVIKRMYYGDVTKNVRRWEKGEGLNDNLAVNNVISIVADAYANDHFFDIRYIAWMGVRWKVTSVEVQPPRLLLTIGEVYNGPTD